MENIKKIDELYNLDHKDRKEKVVLGLSYSIESLVCAYLLKIQKYDLIAVTVTNSLDNFSGDQGKFLSCHLNSDKINFLKEFCHKLGIPHLLIESRDEFNEFVFERWVSDKVIGQRPTQCWNCHELRMRLLFLKKKELGATYLATGHFGKVFNTSNLNQIAVYSSNEENLDQSHVLAKLPQEILSALLLPLSDISKKDVLKLADNFGIHLNQPEGVFDQCFKGEREISELIEKNVAGSIIKDGDAIELDLNHATYRHAGIHFYEVGQPFIRSDYQIESKKVIGEYFFSEKNILLVDEEMFFRTYIKIKECQFAPDFFPVSPFRAAIKLLDSEIVDCWVYPKNLSSVHIEFIEKIKIIPNTIVTVFKKKGKNSKVLISGKINFHLNDQIKEGEQDEEMVNPLLDF